MKALVYTAPREMSLQEREIPFPKKGEVLVAVMCCGICGSDVHGYTGESGRRTPPLIMGHEFCGIVEATGPGVALELLHKRVVVQPVLFCGSCDQCISGHEQRCRNRKLFGADLDGGMAEFVAVPEKNIIEMPESLDFVTATLTEPLAVAFHAIKRAGGLQGKNVLICGGGPIGIMTLLIARVAGARCIVVTEPNEGRRKIVKSFNPDLVVNPSDSEWTKRLNGFVPGGRADVSFDAVGIAPTFEQALERTVTGGVVVEVGGWKTLSLPMNILVRKELDIRGTFNYLPDEFRQCMELLSGNVSLYRSLISHKVALEQGNDIFKKLSESPSEFGKVVFELKERE